jgi:transketolase
LEDLSYYQNIAKQIRLAVLDIIYSTRSPHIGSSFSIVEILVALYFKVLNVFPNNPTHEDRDRFILSKGHACPTLYAVLSKKGFISHDEMCQFAIDDCLFEHHPSIDLEHGIETSTGSLGHGLSVGAGLALAGKIDRKNYKVYVLLSDGELNEGSTWEAVMFAGHHKLNNLIAMIDCNKIQALGQTKDIIDLNPLKDKWEDFGWHAQEVDGHDFNQIFKALNSLNPSKSNVIILDTLKGKGVSFMENNLLWHYRAPDDEEYARAKEEMQK